MKIIEENKMALIEFTSKSCTPCIAISHRITEWNKEHPNIVFQTISVDEHPDIAAKFGIFSVPAVVFYVDTKKMLEKAGYFSVEELLDQIERIEQIYEKR